MSDPSWRERLYARRLAPTARYRDRVWQILCADFLQRFVPEDGAVLDLGTGWGEFANHIRAARRYALDANEASRPHLQPGVEFLHQESPRPWPLDDGSLDTVFTSNFLEHLPDKAAAERTLVEAFRCLRPGGRVVCMGPNARLVGGAYWDFWDHHLPLTETSCAELLELCGFELDLVAPRFLPYTMVRGFRPPVPLLRLYLRCPPVWRVFGRQFLVVGHRPLPSGGDA